MEEGQNENTVFYSLYKLLNDGEAIGNIVSCIEINGIYSKDKYGRVIKISRNSHSVEIEKIKKALLYSDYIDHLDLTMHGTITEVDFARNWLKLNSKENRNNVYIKNGWFEDEYSDFRKQQKLHPIKKIEFNQPFRVSKQSKREGVLSEWLVAKKFEVGVTLKETRKELWDILKVINPDLFRACSEDTRKNFFRHQMLCVFKTGRRKNRG